MMPLPNGYALRDARPDDLDAIADLRRAVGWAVHEWALRVVLGRPGRCVLATTSDGAVAAVGSGIAYGSLGFVGNMVVAEGHRRRGLGSIILGAVMEFLGDAGCRRLELFATADGRPLYERHGFMAQEPSVMATLHRDAPPAGGDEIEVVPAGPAWLDEIAAYDAPRFGGDRRAVLGALPTGDADPLLVARAESGDVRGYAWVRPALERIGPFVADEPEVAAALVRGAFARGGARTLSFNVSTANRSAIAWLESLGRRPEPWDGRMARGPSIPRRAETLYGTVVGALG